MGLCDDLRARRVSIAVERRLTPDADTPQQYRGLRRRLAAWGNTAPDWAVDLGLGLGLIREVEVRRREGSDLREGVAMFPDPDGGYVICYGSRERRVALVFRDAAGRHRDEMGRFV